MEGSTESEFSEEISSFLDVLSFLDRSKQFVAARPDLSDVICPVPGCASTATFNDSVRRLNDHVEKHIAVFLTTEQSATMDGSFGSWARSFS